MTGTSQKNVPVGKNVGPEVLDNLSALLINV